MITKRNIYYRFMEWLARKVFPKREVIRATETPEDEVAIYVPTHSTATGPSTMILYFDRPIRPWVIGYLNDKKVAPNFIFHNFLYGRGQKLKWFWRMLSRIIKFLLIPLLRANNPIWIDRSPAGVIKAYKDSVETLESGKNVVVFPEAYFKHSEESQEKGLQIGAYSPYVHYLNEGFVDIARAYYKKTKKTVKFYPVYIPMDIMNIYVGAPVEYDPDNSAKDERSRITEYIQQEITRMGESLPPHRKAEFVNNEFYRCYGEYSPSDEAYFNSVNCRRSD